MRKTYISGPMRGYPLFNFPAFFECEEYVRDHLRREVINPARQDMEVEGFNPFTDKPTEEQVADWLARDLRDISGVQELILLPGWRQSKGAKKELAHYLRHRKRPEWKVWEYAPLEPVNYRTKGFTPVMLDQYNVPLEEALSENDLLVKLQQEVDEASKSWRVNVGEPPAHPQTIPEAYHMAKGYIAGRKEVENEPGLRLVPPTGEVRTTSETGGQKGVKPERWDLLPWDELAEVARLYGYGATKYADRNWEKGYEYGKSFAALQRHILAWWYGEDDDPEHKLSHLTSVVFHALALMRFRRFPQFDDRPRFEHSQERIESLKPQ